MTELLKTIYCQLSTIYHRRSPKENETLPEVEKITRGW